MGRQPAPDLTVLHIHRLEGCPLGADSPRVLALEQAVKDVVEKFRKQEEAVDKAIARVREDVAKYDSRLAELQAKVDQGTISEEEKAEIEAIQARTLDKINALDPTKDATLPGEGGAENPPTPTDGGTTPDGTTEGTLPEATLPGSGGEPA